MLYWSYEAYYHALTSILWTVPLCRQTSGLTGVLPGLLLTIIAIAGRVWHDPTRH